MIKDLNLVFIGEKTNYLDEKISSGQGITTLLPFFHSCDALSFRQILIEQELQVTKCNVFENEKLLYFFYGRPAYKNSDQVCSSLLSYLPIIFILKSEYMNNIKRIVPFDTGAFKVGLYKEFIHPKMKMEHFFLTPNKEALSKTVSYFFENNNSYFLGRPKKEIKFDPLDFEIESYYNLIKNVGRSLVDDRKATIEIQLEVNIKLTTESVEAVILPENFLTSEMVIQVLKEELKVELLSYESYGLPSNQYYSEVLNITKKYLEEKGGFYA